MRITIKIIISLTLLLILGVPAAAQKKELSQARDYIKSGKNFDKAEALMSDLLKRDTTQRRNIKVYTTWLDAVRAQYEAANEKLYLKQKYDTAAFYGVIRRMQLVSIALDSVDALPDKKGRVRPSYRKTNGEMLNSLRTNLYYGGTYNVRKGDYKTAFDFFDTYIDASRQPLFEAFNYQQSDSMLTQAAYWATLCGYKLQDAARTLQYHQLALNDSSKGQFTLQYICEAYRLQKDEARMIETLRKGFARYPEYLYFFPRLADYYTAKHRNDSVLALANRGLEADAKGQIFLLAKSIALLNMERYDDCIAATRQLLELNDKQPEALFNLATCFLNQALVVEQENQPRKNRQVLHKLYTDAKPYMEQYRQLAPTEKQRWAPALYRIYLNLNMGKQFDEIDKLMRQ